MTNDKTSHQRMNKPKGRSACQDPNKTDKAGRTKIFSYTSSGNLDKVKELVERGADVNHRDNAGWAPLHEAALKGQYEIARYLIQSGANANVRGFEDDTPLHDACSYGYPDCVQLLIDSGADVYALNADKKRPIDLCEDDDCIRIVKNRMKQVDDLAERDQQGRTALHRVCEKGTIEQIEQLLKSGLDSNATDIHSWTPLHIAAEHGRLEAIQALTQAGADINSTNDQGQTALHIACQQGHDAVASYLVDTGVDIHATDNDQQTAYQVAKSVTIRQIITARIDQERKLRATTEAIDEVTFVSNTKQKRKAEDNQLSREERKIQAIMRAFEKAEKKQQAAKTKKTNNDNLVHNKPVNNDKKRKQTRQESRECSVDSQSDQHSHIHHQPNHASKKSNHVDFSKLDPHKKDTSGRTHLHRWSIRGDVQAVKALLDIGANPCEKDNAGYTPLHEAALRGKTDVVRLLLENHADVNSKGADMDTPLHDATENGFPEVVQLLLEYGADVDVKNSKGHTPLDIAIQEENDEIEMLLRDHKNIKPKKRKLNLNHDKFQDYTQLSQTTSPTQPQSPTSPIGTFDVSAKAHARQLSGQHLPKKSLKPHLAKTEAVPPDGPHTPIPTPPPERWHKAIKKEEEDFHSKNEDLYPSLHCASRYLPLYTIQLVNDLNSHFFVVDLQISLLLGITTHQLMNQYPHLHRRQVLSKEKERLWSPLSSMICASHEYLKHDFDSMSAFRESEKQRFLESDIFFVRLDQIVSMIKDDYSHLSESLITINLDIGYTAEYSVPQKKRNMKLPPKFAMKMKKCGMLKFDQQQQNLM